MGPDNPCYSVLISEVRMIQRQLNNGSLATIRTTNSITPTVLQWLDSLYDYSHYISDQEQFQNWKNIN